MEKSFHCDVWHLLCLQTMYLVEPGLLSGAPRWRLVRTSSEWRGSGRFFRLVCSFVRVGRAVSKAAFHNNITTGGHVRLNTTKEIFYSSFVLSNWRPRMIRDVSSLAYTKLYSLFLLIYSFIYCIIIILKIQTVFPTHIGNPFITTILSVDVAHTLITATRWT